MERAEENLGRAIGYEFLAKKEIGKSLLVLGYYVKREHGPVFWRFTFYTPRGDKWPLVHLGIESKLGALKFPE